MPPLQTRRHTHRDAGRGLTRARTCTARCVHTACMAAAKAASHAGIAAPAHNTHVVHTYTNSVSSSLLTYRRADKQTHTLHLLRAPTHCCQCLERWWAVGRAPLSACPLCASVSPRAVLCCGEQGCMGDPQTLLMAGCPGSGVLRPGAFPPPPPRRGAYAPGAGCMHGLGACARTEGGCICAHALGYV